MNPTQDKYKKEINILQGDIKEPVAEPDMVRVDGIMIPSKTIDLRHLSDAAVTSLTTSVTTVLQSAYPVGAVYISVVATNPATLFGFGTWSAFGAGRVMVGLNAADTDFDTVEETGGAKTHTLTTAEMPAHTHNVLIYYGSGALNTRVPALDSFAINDTNVTSSTGGGGAHSNVQPYITCFFFKRIL